MGVGESAPAPPVVSQPSPDDVELAGRMIEESISAEEEEREEDPVVEIDTHEVLDLILSRQVLIVDLRGGGVSGWRTMLPLCAYVCAKARKIRTSLLDIRHVATCMARRDIRRHVAPAAIVSLSSAEPDVPPVEESSRWRVRCTRPTRLDNYVAGYCLTWADAYSAVAVCAIEESTASEKQMGIYLSCRISQVWQVHQDRPLTLDRAREVLGHLFARPSATTVLPPPVSTPTYVPGAATSAESAAARSAADAPVSLASAPSTLASTDSKKATNAHVDLGDGKSSSDPLLWTSFRDPPAVELKAAMSYMRWAGPDHVHPLRPQDFEAALLEEPSPSPHPTSFFTGLGPHFGQDTDASLGATTLRT